MTNDELEAIRARASEIVIARRETHERDKAVMFQAAADRRNLIAAYDALETNALRELADAQTAYVARGMELRDAQARLAEATELLARAEDDLGEWERIHGSDPQTTRLRLEIMGFRAPDSAPGVVLHNGDTMEFVSSNTEDGLTIKDVKITRAADQPEDAVK